MVSPAILFHILFLEGSLMTRGRRPDGASRAERLEGSAVAKARLRMILETLTGKRTVAQACLALGIGDRRFHKLTKQFLKAGLTGLEPRAAGRPGIRRDDDLRIEELEKMNRDLRIDLRAAQIREEIALTMPRLLKPSERTSKARRRKRRRPRQHAVINGA